VAETIVSSKEILKTRNCSAAACIIAVTITSHDDAN
jgi:hypothetical protein